MWASLLATLLNSVLGLVVRGVDDARREELAREKGKADEDAAQAKAGEEAEGELASEAAKDVSEDDAIKQIGEGNA